MRDMSKAIRQELQGWGPDLSHIPNQELVEYASILSAYAADVRQEVERRNLPTPEEAHP